MPADVTDRVMDLCKRRGFLWPAYEVYGGLAGFYDYGPLGAAMKNRFETLWREVFHDCAVPMAEVFCPRVTPFDVLKASGHVDEFSDLVAKCAKGHPQRADHLIAAAGFEGNADVLDGAAIDAEITARKPKCPVCGSQEWSGAAPQNLMFQTEIGPGSGRTGFLRPETAQGIFTDFPHLLRHFRSKLPFGGTQVGGSNRNEISPRQGMLRLREFNMMEAEVFFADTDDPGPEVLAAFARIKDQEATFVPGDTEEPVRCTFEAAVHGGKATGGAKLVKNEALAYFLALTQEFLQAAGMDPARMRFRQHLPDEMAHYASDCWDAEFESGRYGWVECVGIADRGCYDLTQHAKATGKAGDFQYALDLPEPVAFEGTRRVPVMGVLGKTFKADAKAVAAAMDADWQKALAALADADRFDEDWLDDELVLREPGPPEPATGPWTARLADGRELDVPAEGYQIVAGTWTVTGRRLIPRVIEPSFGVDRILYALWEHAYEETEKEGEPYTRLRLSPHVAPVQVAVLPLMGKEGLPETARRIEADLRRAGIRTDYDESGNIGRRYARQDEVGTPYCITIDTDTASDDAVTVRERDSTEQERVVVGDLVAYLRRRFERVPAPTLVAA